MSNSVICRGARESTLAPPLPRFVTTKPAFGFLNNPQNELNGPRGITSPQASDTGANPIAFSPLHLVEIGRGMKTLPGLSPELGQLSQPTNACLVSCCKT